tara:strand:+ start:497 stop:670 length:174 start_codon:yes stop_codon:yes gene_type:complete
MNSDEEIQSNTCEIIKVSQLFVKDVKELEKEYELVKEQLIKEIIEEVLLDISKEDTS